MGIGYWFRRDRRLADNEALTLASRRAKQAAGELFCFYLAESLATYQPEFAPSELRVRSLEASLSALDGTLGGKLAVVSEQAQLVEALRLAGVSEVFAMKSFDPEGLAAESAMARNLGAAGITLNLIGSGYAVEPGSVRKDDGSPLKVYTPFYKRWSLAEAKPPLPRPELMLGRLPVAPVSFAPTERQQRVRAGEASAQRTLQRFLVNRVSGYAELRDRADLGGTSHLSHALSHGEIHPRTILAQLPPASPGAEVFRREIAWREFYADVLFHNPSTLWGYLDAKYALMRYDEGQEAEARFEAWRHGQTGYPIVDAGMRQLLTSGWMHNRVRMITASFLVKDLHLPWVRGAAWFESQLTDFDPASNAHGWQWTAGCGTDASPYFRVFNPTLQGQKFDPTGNYVRQYVSELDHLSAKEIHEPWKYIHGLAKGYPAPIVDHAQERDEALRRLEELKQRVNGN